MAKFNPGQRVKVDLSNMMIGGVGFGAAVTDAMGQIVRQVSENPSRYLVELLFAFKGVKEVEVPEGRIKG